MLRRAWGIAPYLIRARAQLGPHIGIPIPIDKGQINGVVLVLLDIANQIVLGVRRLLARNPSDRRDDVQRARPLIRTAGRDGAIGAAAVDGAFRRAPGDADGDGGADDAAFARLTEGCDAHGDGLADGVADGVGQGAFGAALGLAGGGADNGRPIDADLLVGHGHGFGGIFGAAA